MGIRKIQSDESGAIALSLLLFVLFPSLVTLGIYGYETATGEPIIDAESLPTVLGWQIDWVWQVVGVIAIVIIVLYTITILIKNPKSNRR